MRTNALALVALAPAALGCTGAVASSAEQADAETTASTTAVVIVERTGDDGHGSRAEASARFLRVDARVPADDALRAIGAGLDLPARGTCANIAELAPATGQAAPVVELIDVGAVSLEAAGGETRLVPRQLPDVTDLVSGIVYARAAELALLPADARYIVHVGGGRDLDAFDAVAWAPGDPADVRISGEDVAGLVVANGPVVDLAWTPGGSDDAVYVDVAPGRVRCLLGEAGRDGVERATIPASMLADAGGALVVHRVHRESLPAHGIDSGEIRFDFARSSSYVRR
jgi:hypothetical protein